MSPDRWQVLPGGQGDIPDGSRFAVGFDGSHSHDETAIVVCIESDYLSLDLLIERSTDDPPSWGSSARR